MKKLFGTDGVRGVANSELTAELADELGRAGAFVLTSAIHKPRILVGRDTRVSGHMLEAALIAGIMSVGADVIPVGVIPTPGIAFLTRYYSCDAGVMISASHNPMEDNGIKFFDAYGYKLPDALEERIEKIILEKQELPRPTGENLGRLIKLKNPKRDYMDFLLETIDVRLDGLKLVLDCANGASSEIAPRLFEELGAEVLPFYNNPDGHNINKNCGSTHPDRISELVVEQGADAGLAFDGDADRLIACDERGGEIDGDHILAVCALALNKEGKLAGNTVVGTVMSNMGLEKALKQQNIQLEKTGVGDRYVLEQMLAHKYTIGGEKSGHIIFLNYNTTGDGMLSALQLLRAKVKSGLEMSKLVSVMRNMPQVIVNVMVDNAAKNNFSEYPEIAEAISGAELRLGDKGRVLVRASGTEPLIRIMIEGENKGEINALALNIAEKMVKAMNAKIKK